MPRNINRKGFFQSTKNPELEQHKIAFDFRDIFARPVLKTYAETCSNEELAEDIMTALVNTRKLVKVPD